MHQSQNLVNIADLDDLPTLVVIWMNTDANSKTIVELGNNTLQLLVSWSTVIHFIDFCKIYSDIFQIFKEK